LPFFQQGPSWKIKKEPHVFGISVRAIAPLMISAACTPGRAYALDHREDCGVTHIGTTAHMTAA
jgi:hypothetical protein